ncbi:hypothetical protein [Streptomyces sp. NPDC097619]|uniref:DUF7144 family membrane protein n=1 Tax=Streptomyces sp. NPDC097619 TaxID=3157228 RepID=UPI00333056B7
MTQSQPNPNPGPDPAAGPTAPKTASWGDSPGAHGRGRSPDQASHEAWVRGGVAFAGTLLLCTGILAVLQGIAAAAEDDVYARVGSYVYKFDLTAWGWIHIIVGALAIVTGVGLLKDQAWARFAGIFLASLSLVTQFLFLPYAPVWSVIVIGIDVFIIWALVSREDRAEAPA